MIIGADVGTQSLKVAVLDDRLRTIGRAACCHRPSYPKPGWVEQAPGLWTAALGPRCDRSSPNDQETRGTKRNSPGWLRTSSIG